MIKKDDKLTKQQKIQNKNKVSEISLTKKILISANIFYFLVFFGFILTTNLDNPTIFHKYTVAYFEKLILLLVLIIPYNLLILFLLNDTLKVIFNKKNYNVSIFWRAVIILSFILLLLISTELFLRMKPKPFAEDFHPFLQAMNTKKNEGNLHVNSEGFRYDEMSIEKPKDVYRIFLLGGSTVFDEDRSYEESISKQVENSLRKYYPEKKIQVINAGYKRYTSAHSLILYETKVADYDPNMIVIWQGFNDMYYSCIADIPGFSPIRTYKNDYSHFYEALSRIINNYFNYHLSFNTLDRLMKAIYENFYADLRAKLANQKTNITYTDNIEFPSLDAFTRNMTYIVKLARADDVKIILGNQPISYADDPDAYVLAHHYCRKGNEYASLNSLRMGMDQFNAASKKIAEVNNIPFIDLESLLPKTRRYFIDDVHYTDEGNQKVAEAVSKAIINSKYIVQ